MPTSGVAGPKSTHTFIFNRNNQTTLQRSRSHLGGPSKLRKIHFPKIWEFKHCLCPRPQRPQSHQETQVPNVEEPGRLPGQGPHSPYSSCPHTLGSLILSLRGAACVCLTGRLVPYVAGCFTPGQLLYHTVLSFCHCIVLQSTSLRPHQPTE